ncbi:unnamed protein product [Cyclocybe aegerita]|uniref:RING-type domain-containing protein n=1 Tax=Cyclocybe aegerita TaxID=1973307 RepID=A0A8S0X713_CYCAE|nr:unnamed protein product [Cyclocybe aegerita]
MPICPQCDNRTFSNKEALLQHMRSSSAWHPFCSQCDRRFVSQTAFDAHMAAKHPPTFDCTTCNKSFHAQFALEDHYRGSQAHPNCVRCGRGFFDEPAREEHLQTAHPKSPCPPCGGIIIYDDALDQHYLTPKITLLARDAPGDSETKIRIESTSRRVIPTCTAQHCGVGCLDDAALELHIEMVHAPTPTVVGVRPVAVAPSAGSSALSAHEDTKIEKPKPQEEPLYSTGFTPLSPKSFPQRLLIGERRMDSPDIQLEANFMSPLNAVQPLFSPTSLPRPGGIIEELWSSRENSNVQVRTPRAPDTGKSPECPSSFAAAVSARPSSWASPTSSSQSPPRHSIAASVPLPSPPSLGSPSWLDDNSSRSQGSTASRFSPPSSSRYYEVPRRPYVSPSHPSASSSVASLIESSRYSIPATRAYDTVRQFSPPRISPPHASSDWHPRLYPGSVRAGRTASLTRPGVASGSQMGFGSYSHNHLTSTFSFGSGSITETSPISAFGRSEASGSSGGGAGAMGEQVDWRSLMGSRDSRASLFSESQLTPRAELPFSRPELVPSTSQAHLLQGQVLTPISPSLATISSPASSALEHSPGSAHPEPETRPTTASSSQASPQQKITYTAPSECACSPSVASPMGLGVLPSISPLASTPIDISVFDYPEARQPLPDSPPPTQTVSPVTVIEEIAALPCPSEEPSSNPTTPQKCIQTSPLSSPLPTSVAPLPTSNPNPLHCRGCLADECDDITATMCGHIFCNRCITDAVIKTSRCPVCMTPTLLYCLFRLDLAA